MVMDFRHRVFEPEPRSFDAVAHACEVQEASVVSLESPDDGVGKIARKGLKGSLRTGDERQKLSVTGIIQRVEAQNRWNPVHRRDGATRTHEGPSNHHLALRVKYPVSVRVVLADVVDDRRRRVDRD